MSEELQHWHDRAVAAEAEVERLRAAIKAHDEYQEKHDLGSGDCAPVETFLKRS